MYCHNCETEIALDSKPARNEACPNCNAYLHCCLNCRFYDANAHNECREPQAEWVKDKEMANFCSYFEARRELKTRDTARRDEARKKLDDLFKKP